MLASHSTARVLTSELVSGATWQEMLRWPQDERDLAGECLFRFVFRSLYGMHRFNGDPHPGNYLFHGGGRVTFLDFGLVKRFTDAEMATFIGMVKAAAYEHDVPTFRRIVEDAGMLRRGAPADDDAIGDYFGQFYESVKDDKVVTWSSEYASRIVRHTFDRTQPDLAIRDRAARVRVHPADQSRPVRAARRAAGDRATTGGWPRSCGRSCRARRARRWPKPSSRGSRSDAAVTVRCPADRLLAHPSPQLAPAADRHRFGVDLDAASEAARPQRVARSGQQTHSLDVEPRRSRSIKAASDSVDASETTTRRSADLALHRRAAASAPSGVSAPPRTSTPWSCR